MDYVHEPAIKGGSEGAGLWPYTAGNRVDLSNRMLLVLLDEMNLARVEYYFSEFLSRLLTAQGLQHQVLNAVHHREEAAIVAQAGQRGWITVATNMAGRGTDIKLGPGIADMGGLHVIATEHNESGRIDRQLFGRCARQGDPGSAQAIVSLDDEFVSRYAKRLAGLLKRRYATQQAKEQQGRESAGAEREKDAGHSIALVQEPQTEKPERPEAPKAEGAAAPTFSRAHPVTFLFRYVQWRADRIALRRRKAVIKTDHWLDDHLSFAGRE